MRRGFRQRLCAGGLVLVTGLALAGCGSDPISVRVLESDDPFTLGDGSGSAELLALDPATGETLWSIPVPEPDTYTAGSGPAVLAGDRVVLATEWPSGMVAVGLADGKPLWQAEVAGSVRAIGRAGSLTMLDVASSGSDVSWLYGFDDAAGLVAWEVRHDPETGPAAIAPDLVFLVTGEPRRVEARRPSDGSMAWSEDRAGGYWVWSDGERVYAFGDAGEVVALDRETGGVRWEQPALQPERLVLGAGYVVGWRDLGLRDRTLVAAAAAETGEMLWSHTLNGTVKAEVVGDTVILTQRRDHLERLIALNAGTGHRLWTRACECETAACRCSVAGAAGGVVFVGDGDRLVALDLATGAEAWSVTLQDEVGRALVAEGRVFVGTTTGVASTENAGTITALDPADGSIFWQRDLPLGVPYRPVLVGSQLLVVAHNPTPTEI